jgi:hypothetical protein
MQRLDRFSALGLVCALAVAGLGCGGDDDDSGMDSGTPIGTGGVGSGTGGTMSGTGGTSSGTGGTRGGTGGSMVMTPMCDDTVPTTATCGGTNCPAASGMAALVCSVPCCLADNTCGFKRARMGMVGECVPVGVPDPNCPDMMGAGSTMEGCCAVSGHCGVISGVDMTCITSSPLLPMLMPGDACEPGDGGTADGGN